MYEKFYNFDVPPFECTPDPRFFYASEQHREALAAIEYTIRMRKGIVMVTGAIGSGKTTVGRTMLERCGDCATIVQVMHGHSKGAELIKHVLRSLGVVMRRTEEHAECLERLQVHLREYAGRGKPVVLFVDEAQTLSDEALEELRLISNFDTNTQRLLQLVLIGQPELRDRIRSPQMAPLRQRIVMAKQIASLSIQETATYIAHRIQAASADKENVGVSFAGDAIETLYGFTRGTPRPVNVICDNCLLLGYVHEARRITSSMVRKVIEDMVPDFGDTRSSVSVAPERKLALAGGM